jgi:Rrf2 family iron-sulfur cluster assembly transcriptional regulator
MFSKACQYAIKSMVYIASENDTGRKVSIKEVCDNIHAPAHFTAKIMQSLTRNDFISSQKGPNGGFSLDKHQLNRRLIDIVTVIDGVTLFTGCYLGLKHCSETKPCPLHDKFIGIRTDLKNLLENTTIQELGQKLKNGSFFLSRQELL